jgi:hypothetical protein
MSGAMTSSRIAPTMDASIGCSMCSTSSPTNAWRSAQSQNQGHRLMENLTRLPDELLNGGGLLHVAGSSGPRPHASLRYKPPVPECLSQPLPGGRLRYGHRLTLAPAQTLN